MGALIYITDKNIIGKDITTPPRLSLETLNWLVSNLDKGEKVLLGRQICFKEGQLIDRNVDNQSTK